MQVSVEQTSNLGRRVIIAIPAQEVENEYHARLKRLVKTKSIKGFRPGKAPVQVVENLDGGRVRLEVIKDLMRSTFYDAVAEQKLHLAGIPEFQAQKIVPGQDLEYVATCEVYPEISLASFSGVEVEKLVSHVRDHDVNTTIEKLQKQKITWDSVERAAVDGDQLVIDFVGTKEGAHFSGGSAEDFSLVLGSATMIPGFEAGLIGATPGQEVILDLAFPENYHHADLAGQSVQFKVTVKKVSAPKLPMVDDAFAQELGITGGAEALQAELRKNMERELEKALHDQLKKRVMDKLVELNPLDLPSALVTHECEHLRELTMESLGKGAQNIQKDQIPLKLFEAEAHRRVHLALLLAEFIKQSKLEVDKDKVRQKIEQLAAVYDDPAQVVAWFYGDEKRLSNIETLILEEQAVDVLLQQAHVTEKAVDYLEAMQTQQ